MLLILSYLPTPSARAGYDTRSIFKRSLTGWNSEYSFSETSWFIKAEEPNLPYYLPVAGGRIIGFIHFPMVLVLCEMQLVSSRIWTRVAVSISYDDNHYNTGTSKYLSKYYTKWSRLAVILSLLMQWRGAFGETTQSWDLVSEILIFGKNPVVSDSFTLMFSRKKILAKKSSAQLRKE